MRVFIPLQRQPGFRVSGILFLNMLFARYYWVKYGNLVERDHGLPAEGAARFRITRWTIVMRAALSQMQWRQSALGGLCRLYWYRLYIFARRRGYSPAEINQEIHAFCEALIATGGGYSVSAEPQRICPSCGNEFSGGMEFCPVCILRKAQANKHHGEVEGGRRCNG